MRNELLISAVGVSKKFGAVKAVGEVSLDVYKGGVYGVAGLNGAGKSTLLAILAGVMRPSGGMVYYRGSPIYPGSDSEGRKGARSLKIGYVPQDIALFADLSVRDNLKFWALACIYGKGDGAKTGEIADRIRRAADSAGLAERMSDKVRVLSGGLKRRVNIAAALAANPEVLIMDEPTAGLDVKNRRDILNFISILARDGNRGLAVVCTSHQSGELEMVSDRLLLLDRGEVAYDGAPEDVFKGRYSDYRSIDDILYSMGNEARIN